MAAEAPTDEAGEAGAAAAPAKPKSKLGLIIAIVVVLAAGGGGGWFMMSKKSGGHAAPAGEHGEGGGEHGEAAAEGAGGANYLSLTPSFTVNLEDEEASRYLQVEMEVRANSTHTLDQVKLHTPRIRNAILLLLGQQHYHELSTRAGKEALQAKVLGEIQKIMQAETGEPGVTAVYFTSFVMQ